jgi:chromate transport protein ChrA
MEFLQLIIIAVALEALWETCKMFWQEGKLNIDRIGAALLGVFLCVAAKVDFFVIVQLPLFVPYAGMVLSGLIISRGANFVHDIMSAVEGIKK